jgi:hypothetical protein
VTTTTSTDVTTTIAKNEPSIHTTNSPSNILPQLTTIEKITKITKTESDPQFTDSPTVIIGTQSNEGEVTPTSEESTTPAATYIYIVTVSVAHTPTISSADSGQFKKVQQQVQPKTQKVQQLLTNCHPAGD